MTEIDPVATARIRRLARDTGTNIVLSSSWRRHNELAVRLRAQGLEWDDQTPDLDERTSRQKNGYGHRGREIRAWLDAHPDVTQFAIVDDDPDAGEGDGLAPHFVKTSWVHGLTVAHVARLRALLA